MWHLALGLSFEAHLLLPRGLLGHLLLQHRHVLVEHALAAIDHDYRLGAIDSHRFDIMFQSGKHGTGQFAAGGACVRSMKFATGFWRDHKQGKMPPQGCQALDLMHTAGQAEAHSTPSPPSDYSHQVYVTQAGHV